MRGRGLGDIARAKGMAQVARKARDRQPLLLPLLARNGHPNRNGHPIAETQRGAGRGPAEVPIHS